MRAEIELQSLTMENLKYLIVALVGAGLIAWAVVTLNILLALAGCVAVAWAVQTWIKNL